MAQIRSIQALRAIAAISVASGHLLGEAMNMPRPPSFVTAPILLDISGAGVDLFFVISGFIMVYASQDLFADVNGWNIFLRRRIARVVPLYWLMTTLFLVALTVFPHALSSAKPTDLEILKSYFFIPYTHAGSDLVRPIYKLGWTLDYEMFFYLAFAALLFLPIRSAIRSLSILFASLAALGCILKLPPGPLAFWTDPIILEFVAGACIALAFLGGRRLPSSVAVTLFVLGIIGVVLAPIVNLPTDGPWRVLVRGLPAALIVAAAALKRDSFISLRWLSIAPVALGDASYAIYLGHPWLIRMFHLVWTHTHLPAWIFVATVLALLAPFSLLVHRYIERPLTQFARRLMAARTQRLAASPS